MNLNTVFIGKSDEEIVQLAGQIETWARRARELVKRKRAILDFAKDLSDQTRTELESKHAATLEAHIVMTDLMDIADEA